MREKATKKKTDAEERSGILGFLFGAQKEESKNKDITRKTDTQVYIHLSHPRSLATYLLVSYLATISHSHISQPPQVLRIEEDITDAEKAQIKLMSMFYFSIVIFDF